MFSVFFKRYRDRNLERDELFCFVGLKHLFRERDQLFSAASLDERLSRFQPIAAEFVYKNYPSLLNDAKRISALICAAVEVANLETALSLNILAKKIERDAKVEASQSQLPLL